MKRLKRALTVVAVGLIYGLIALYCVAAVAFAAFG